MRHALLRQRGQPCSVCRLEASKQTAQLVALSPSDSALSASAARDRFGIMTTNPIPMHPLAFQGGPGRARDSSMHDLFFSFFFRTDGHIPVQGPDSHMQPEASPGSSVGNAAMVWFILIGFLSLFRSATSHPVENTQKYRYF